MRMILLIHKQYNTRFTPTVDILSCWNYWILYMPTWHSVCHIAGK